MTTGNAAVLGRFFEEFSRVLAGDGDLLDVAHRYVEPDCVAELGVLEGDVVGPEGIVRYFEGQLAVVDGMHIDPEELIEIGDRVVVPFRLTGRAKETGLPIDFRYTQLFTLRGGRLAHIRMYADKERALAAAEGTRSVRPMHEAKIDETEHGLVPADNGWFILNLRDIAWETTPGGGIWCGFESPAPPRNPLGIGVHILYPGEAPGFYHSESDQEGFLVLSGECVAIVEGEERRMVQWDYLHSPPGTAHITVGAGDGPCAILMVGMRSPDHTTKYIPDPAAARHGAAVETATDDPREAYAGRPPIVPASSPWPRDQI